MEAKKSVRADLEWRKPVFFQIGLIIALVVIFMAFEFVRATESNTGFKPADIDVPDEILIISTTHNEPNTPPPTPPAPQITSILEIVNNTTEVGSLFIDAGSDPGLSIPDVIVPIPDKPEEIHIPEIFRVVEESPEFIGGEDARQKFLKDNLVYPKIARETGQEGRVTVEFIVEPNGTLSNFRIARSAPGAPSLDEEALRVAKLMPKWKAGKQRGNAVRVMYTMPIVFTLN